LWTVNAALRNAEYGAGDEARRGVADALKLATGRNVSVLAALCLARIGDTNAACKLADQLARDYSTDTMLAVYRLPVIQAAIALSDGNAPRALEILEDVQPYDLARPSPWGMANMYPSFLRGEAYALLGNAQSAEKEFLQVVDHPGLTLNSPLAVLAPLQLARLYASGGDRGQARALYNRFLLQWNDADPDAKPLRGARVELARLH
jgi:tetratricopeptide (TPR) repeat protein